MLDMKRFKKKSLASNILKSMFLNKLKLKIAKILGKN